MTALIQRTEGRVLVVELARGEAGNGLNRALQQQLAEAWRAFDSNDDLAVAVLKGSDAVFSIGHDVTELAADASRSPLPDDALFPLHLDKPVIAAIEGPCYGLGFELALSCDLRMAGEGALFGFPDANLQVPYRLASVLLPRMTFAGKSLELLLSGHVLDASGMRQSGLLNQITPKGGSAAAAMDAARSIAQRFPDTHALRKRNIWSLSGLPLPAAMQLARIPRG